MTKTKIPTLEPEAILDDPEQRIVASALLSQLVAIEDIVGANILLCCLCARLGVAAEELQVNDELVVNEPMRDFISNMEDYANFYEGLNWRGK